MTPTEQDKELREKLVETILSILGVTDRTSGNRPEQIATLEQEIVSYITADRKRVALKELEDFRKEVIIMNEKDIRMKLIVEELCASAIKIAHAHIDKELDTVMLREAEKFYNMFLMFEATAGTVTPKERPF